MKTEIIKSSIFESEFKSIFKNQSNNEEILQAFYPSIELFKLYAFLAEP